LFVNIFARVHKVEVHSLGEDNPENLFFAFIITLVPLGIFAFFSQTLKSIYFKLEIFVDYQVAEWLRQLTSNHLPLTVEGSSHAFVFDSFMCKIYLTSLRNIGGSAHK
jgi:hypothetical protein